MNKKLRILAVFAVIIVILGLTGCYKMSDAEKEKVKYLEQSYSEAFKEQAKVQYGKDAKVYNISAETDVLLDPLFGGLGDSSIITTGNLKGTIKIGKESFRGKYFPDLNEIYSQRNIKKIKNSIKDYFSYLNLNIVDFSVTNSAMVDDYLPDNIISYEDMLKDKRFLLITFYVTEDLGKVSPEDFADLERYWKEYTGIEGEHVGSITFIQVKDALSLKEAKYGAYKLRFEYNYTDDDPFDDAKKEFIDGCKKYKIIGSLYLSCDITKDGEGNINHRFRFVYNHI